MPLHVADYLRDTGHLSAAEHGAYMQLIMRYWQDGGLPSDETLIRRYSLLTAEQWIESRPVLAALFDEGWKHKRIDAELEKAAGIISKRRASAEQMHSGRRASAEQVHSISSDTRVPPRTLTEETLTASSVPESASERDWFGETWDSFPQNPASSETKARKALARIKASDYPAVLEGAQRYSKWFAQDCEDRGRTIDAGLGFVPSLANWLDTGQWRDAAKLIIKGEADPSLTTVKVGTPEFAALERMAGKKLMVGESGTRTVPKAELKRAMAAA